MIHNQCKRPIQTFKSLLKLTTLALLTSFLLACGNKGDLYLPEAPEETEETEQTTDG